MDLVSLIASKVLALIVERICLYTTSKGFSKVYHRIVDREFKSY